MTKLEEKLIELKYYSITPIMYLKEDLHYTFRIILKTNKIKLKQIIFDSYNALQMEQEIERNYGLNVLEFSKTTAYFSPVALIS